jgi:hypothetical protein
MPSRRSRAGVITGAVLVVIALGAALAWVVPETVSDGGAAWFKGGVPSSWDVVKVQGLSDAGTVMQAWRVPGPKFGPDTPFLTLLRSNQGEPAGETASEYLIELGIMLRDQGAGDGSIVTLDNGAPAIEWQRPDTLEEAPDIPITDYLMYAEDGKALYMMAFETDTVHFASEIGGVKRVMLSFKGTGH